MQPMLEIIREFRSGVYTILGSFYTKPIFIQVTSGTKGVFIKTIKRTTYSHVFSEIDLWISTAKKGLRSL